MKLKSNNYTLVVLVKVLPNLVIKESTSLGSELFSMNTVFERIDSLNSKYALTLLPNQPKCLTPKT